MWIMFNDDKLFRADSFEIKHFDGGKCSVMAKSNNSEFHYIFNKDYAKCVTLMSEIASVINDGIKILYIREGRISLGDPK
jgi:hypothetical protein